MHGRYFRALVCLFWFTAPWAHAGQAPEVCRFVVATPAITPYVEQVREALSDDGPGYVVLDTREWASAQLGEYLKTKTTPEKTSALSVAKLKEQEPELFAIGETVDQFVLTLLRAAFPRTPVFGNFLFRLKGDRDGTGLGWHRHASRPFFATLEFASQLGTRTRDQITPRGMLFVAVGRVEHRGPPQSLENAESRVTWVDFFSPLAEEPAF